MKRQRILTIIIMELKKLYREPTFLFMILLFPAVMTISFGLAFGAIGPGETKYSIGIVNFDNGTYPQASQYFIGNLTDTGLFNTPITYGSNASADNDLVQGKIDAIIIIPINFGESWKSYHDNPTNQSAWINTTLALKVDKASIFAISAIPPVVQRALLITLVGESNLATPLPIQIANPSLISATQLTQFDYMAPGLFVFAGIFLIMTVAQSFTTEREEGLLKRINTTPTSPSEFITSNVISNMIIAILQVIIVFLIMFLLGYHPLGGSIGIFMAFLLMIIFSFCSVGLGLIVASVAKSAGTATGLAFLFILPQIFFATFVPIGEISAIIGRFLPAYYVTDVLTSIFLRGAPIMSANILIDFIILVSISIVLLILGIFLFGKYGNK
jgi:ABC-2 type transport system permease protein